MDTNITPLLFEGEHMLRTVVDDGKIGWVGLDVCRILGIRDRNQALERLDEDERGWYNVPTPSGSQEAIIVYEPGLRRLIASSRKPVARRFQRLGCSTRCCRPSA